MTDNTGYRLPRWAPRIAKRAIERLYLSSAKGILDKDLVDEVGYALYARCESLLQATQIRSGQPKCPGCGTLFPKAWRQPDEELVCLTCDWRCPLRVYRKTYARRYLMTGGMDDEIRRFMRRFASARSHNDKMVLMDTLIHLSHWASDQGQPLATSFIEGKMKDIMPFLDRLSYGDNTPPEIAQTREEWRRKWARNHWSKGRGQ